MEHTTIAKADVGTVEALGITRAAAAPTVHTSEPKTLRCKIIGHDPSKSYRFFFGWPKLGHDGVLGKVEKKVNVPMGGEPTFMVSVPSGSRVTLKLPGVDEPTVFRADDGVTTEQLICAWMG